MLNLYAVNLPRLFPVDLEIRQAIALQNRLLKFLLIILFPLKKKKMKEKPSLKCHMMIVTMCFKSHSVLVKTHMKLMHY